MAQHADAGQFHSCHSWLKGLVRHIRFGGATSLGGAVLLSETLPVAVNHGTICAHRIPGRVRSTE